MCAPEGLHALATNSQLVNSLPLSVSTVVTRKGAASRSALRKARADRADPSRIRRCQSAYKAPCSCFDHLSGIRLVDAIQPANVVKRRIGPKSALPAREQPRNRSAGGSYEHPDMPLVPANSRRANDTDPAPVLRKFCVRKWQVIAVCLQQKPAQAIDLYESEILRSAFLRTHNPLVPGSSPGGPTN